MILKITDQANFYKQIIDCFERGGIVAIPTDTVYGFAVDATNSQAIERLNNLKRREGRPYTIFVSKNRFEDFSVVVKKKIIDYFVPGPITIILKRNTVGLSSVMPVGNLVVDKIGLRIPQNDFTLKLLNLYSKPLAVTSANLSGAAPLNNAYEIAEKFLDIDLVVDGGVTPGVPSTVLDLSTTPPTVKRKGLIPILEIEKVYGRNVLLDASLKFNLLFVCTGNTCRSPMALGIFRTLIDEGFVDIRSTGTSVIDGMPAAASAQKVVEEYGGSIVEHQTKSLDRELIDWADLILVMEYKHYETILEMRPNAVAKTFLLKEYKRRVQYNEVTDPVGKDIEVYRQSAMEMLPSLKLVARDIEKRFKIRE